MTMAQDQIDAIIRNHGPWLESMAEDARVGFTNLDIKGCMLVACNLANAKLVGTNASCSKMNEVNLGEADLFSADF